MISVEETFIRLLLGAVIGGIIGFEREIHGRAAGFRTQLIVCLASVLIMIISENYYFKIQALDSTLRIDPARISAGALIGIGFLGAGVIVKSGFAIRGLTTAASIWIVSAIGLAIGGGLYIEGFAAAIIAILALMLLRVVERKIKTMRYSQITISMAETEEGDEKITGLLDESGCIIHSVDYERNQSSGEITYHYIISTKDRSVKKEIFRQLQSLDFINKIRISG